MKVIPDNLDLSEYLRDESDSFSVKIRPASAWAQEVKDHFACGPQANTAPVLLWTKTKDRVAFRPGEVTAWSGINGHFKSYFTNQVVLDLCMQGQRVLIVSLEMKPRETMIRMSKQAFGGSDVLPS